MAKTWDDVIREVRDDLWEHDRALDVTGERLDDLDEGSWLSVCVDGVETVRVTRHGTSKHFDPWLPPNPDPLYRYEVWRGDTIIADWIVAVDLADAILGALEAAPACDNDGCYRHRETLG